MKLPIDYLAHPETDARLRKHLGVATENELLDALCPSKAELPARRGIIMGQKNKSPGWSGQCLDSPWTMRRAGAGLEAQRHGCSATAGNWSSALRSRASMSLDI